LQFYHKKTSIKKIQTHSFSLYFFFPFFYIHTTNYKNSKIHKNYIKQFKIYKIAQNNSEQCQADFWSCKTMATRLLHESLPLAARGFTRRHQKIQAAKGSGTTSSLLPFPAGSDTHRHLQKKKK
jgi:hypothetical protein